MAPHTRNHRSMASERRRPTEASVFTAIVNCASETALCDISGFRWMKAQVFTYSLSLKGTLYIIAWLSGILTDSDSAFSGLTFLYNDSKLYITFVLDLL